MRASRYALAYRLGLLDDRTLDPVEVALARIVVYTGDRGVVVDQVPEGAHHTLGHQRRAVGATSLDKLAAEAGFSKGAVQLLAVGIGLGVQRAFDPELPISSLVDLLRSYLERAAPSKKR